jgi:hypothetical protein
MKTEGGRIKKRCFEMAKGKRRRSLKRRGRRAKERDAPVVQLEKAKPRPKDLGDGKNAFYAFLYMVAKIVYVIVAEILHNG